MLFSKKYQTTQRLTGSTRLAAVPARQQAMSPLIEENSRRFGGASLIVVFISLPLATREDAAES